MLIYLLLFHLLIPGQEKIIKNSNGENITFDNIKVTLKSPAEIETFLKKNEKRFQINAKNLIFKKKEKIGKDKFIYHYQQVYNNIPVYQHTVKVLIKKAKNRTEVQTVMLNYYRGKFEIPEKLVSIDSVQSNLKNTLRLNRQPFVKKVFYNGKLSYLLSYPLFLLKNKLYKFEVIVDAGTGKVLYLNNRIKY